MKHKLKVKYYLRYGDDFIVIHQNPEKLKRLCLSVIHFLNDNLRLQLNPKNDIILKASHGLRFLGDMIRPDDRALNRRNCNRIRRRLSFANIGSYHGLVKQHSLSDFTHELDWWIYGLL